MDEATEIATAKLPASENDLKKASEAHKKLEAQVAKTKVDSEAEVVKMESAKDKTDKEKKSLDKKYKALANSPFGRMALEIDGLKEQAKGCKNAVQAEREKLEAYEEMGAEMHKAQTEENAEELAKLLEPLQAKQKSLTISLGEKEAIKTPLAQKVAKCDGALKKLEGKLATLNGEKKGQQDALAQLNQLQTKQKGTLAEYIGAVLSKGDVIKGRVTKLEKQMNAATAKLTSLSIEAKARKATLMANMFKA